MSKYYSKELKVDGEIVESHQISIVTGLDGGGYKLDIPEKELISPRGRDRTSRKNNIANIVEEF